jgi:hypothetical protein
MRTLVFLLLVAACTGEDGKPGEAGQPGDPGTPGAPALTRTVTEPAGDNCPFGGIEVQVGTDTNGNGELDDSEVVAGNTSYVCNGEGTSALVDTAAEPAGANCPFGGTKIETGLDINNNGTLDARDQRVATSYVCTFGPSGAISPSTGVNVITSVSTVSTDDPVTVKLHHEGRSRFPLDINRASTRSTRRSRRGSRCRYFTKDASTASCRRSRYTKSRAPAPAGLPTHVQPASTAAGTAR